MSLYLLEKYNIPAPRYTSYPTVPYWATEPPAPQLWTKAVQQAFEKDPAISLYIHLPYCEKLCTYCGCNKRITKNHAVEAPYIEALLTEWNQYLDILPSKAVLQELHLGGGTPTFFQPKALQRLLQGLQESTTKKDTHHYSLEVHPGTTTKAHLAILAEFGFNRLSIGVQDVAPEVLQIINRQQTLDEVEQCTDWARSLGFVSINFDLVFGLPLQTPVHIQNTMRQVERLRPDRIAFYSYAHVPWIKPSQRAYGESDLPRGLEKRKLYELGRQLLLELGYLEIGMDHFALPQDTLSQALESGTLHRNFMGYTPFHSQLGLALGTSSISDTGTMFVQNEKTVEPYLRRVSNGELPYFRGHQLTQEDQIIRQHILNLMCQGETRWDSPDNQHPSLEIGLTRMGEFLKDGLIELNPYHLKVSEAGKPFVRNIAMALDARYWARQPQGKLFSSVV